MAARSTEAGSDLPASAAETSTVVYQSLLESNSKMEGKMAGLFGHLAELKEEIRLLKDEKKMEMEAEIAMKDTAGRPDAGDDGKEGAKKGKQEDCMSKIFGG